jgi:putative ABC transport system permease protein
MRWLTLSLRRIGDDRAPTAGLAVLILVTALVAAMAPRVLAGLSDGAVRADVREATPAARNIVVMRHTLIGTGPKGDPLGPVDAAGAQLEATFPQPVRKLVTAHDAIVESGRFRVQKPTTDPAFIRFRIQDGVDDHLRYVAGAPPTATVTTRDGVGPEAENDVPVYETAVSTTTAAQFGLELGETVLLSGDSGDPLIGRSPREVYAFATITGIYDVLDPESDYWLDDPLLIHPVIRALSPEAQLLDAELLVDPSVHAALAANASPATRALGYTWRYFIEPDRITGRGLDGLITAFRRLRVAYPSANVTVTADTAMRTGLPALLEDHRARWAAAESIVAVTAFGPALVAVATLVLIAALAGRRRRATLALARSRGASARQVLGPALAEGLLVAVPGAIAAALVAIALVPSGQLSPTLAAAAAVVVVAVSVIVGTVVSVVRARGPERRPGDRVVGRIGPRRLVAEALVVGVAVGAALLLRERGVNATSSAGAIAGFDPLIAAVPALVGVAAGVVVVRLYPLPVRAVAWVAARGRGLVPVLAARRAMDGGASAAVLLVLLATATVGAFTATTLDHLERGADLAAWQDVGGSYRLESPIGPLPTSLDPATLPGVEVVAGVFEANVPVELSGPQALFVLPDAADLEAALAGTPAAPDFPPGTTTPGTGPIPAIVSSSLVAAPRGVKAGQVFKASIEGYTLQYRAVEVRDSFPGVPAGRAFVVAPREWFRAQAPDSRIVPVVTILRAPGTTPAALREAVTAATPIAILTSQAETAAALRSAPVTGAVRTLILAAALVTAAFAALGVAAGLALAGVARSVETAHLRTLGLTRRQALALVLAEHGPTTIAGFVLGGVLGVLLFALLLPGLGLASLIGAPVEVPIVPDAGPLLLILVGMIVVVAVGLLLGAMLQRRVAPTDALRGRFE